MLCNSKNSHFLRFYAHCVNSPRQRQDFKLYLIFKFRLKSPGQDFKLHPSGVQLDNRKNFSCTRS